jgi:hypothetical protein
MLWAVLATVISAPSAKVASTYDEAACSDAEKARITESLGDDDEINCSEPEPVPAVLDCNDARVSLWLGEMIGSCDMPKSQMPGTVPVMRNAEQRLCRDGHCGVDSVPIRPAARSADDLTPILSATSASTFTATWSPHQLEIMLRASQQDGHRLERPPRPC